MQHAQVYAWDVNIVLQIAIHALELNIYTKTHVFKHVQQIIMELPLLVFLDKKNYALSQKHWKDNFNTTRPTSEPD